MHGLPVVPVVGWLFIGASLGAQTPAGRTVEPLYVPRAIQHAYRRGTRSPDGRPSAKVSRISNREGMIDSTTFYLAYFYPRVAVYDDYNGWDTMDFTDAQEFYSDFNDYDVTVKVPVSGQNLNWFWKPLIFIPRALRKESSITWNDLRVIRGSSNPCSSA